MEISTFSQIGIVIVEYLRNKPTTQNNFHIDKINVNRIMNYLTLYVTKLYDFLLFDRISFRIKNVTFSARHNFCQPDSTVL